MYKNVMKSVVMFGLLSCVRDYAEEPQERKETKVVEVNMNNDEEATDIIFNTWYKGEDKISETCRLLSGFIMKMKEGGRVSLYTFINYESDEDLLPDEKKTFVPIIVERINRAKQAGKVGKNSIFLDRKTRCTQIDHKGAGVIQCMSIFTEEDFQKKIQNKRSWWPWSKKS